LLMTMMMIFVDDEIVIRICWLGDYIYHS
jgi:hypothetical protein